MLNETDRHMLKIAYDEAVLGFEEGGCPIGSVLARGGTEVSRGHNQRVQQGDPIAHGEMDALRRAGRQKSYRDTVLYTTLSPCMMCSGAIHLSKIHKVVYALDDKEKGYLRKSKKELNKKLVIVSNILESESKNLLESFFFKLRS